MGVGLRAGRRQSWELYVEGCGFEIPSSAVQQIDNGTDDTAEEDVSPQQMG